MTVGELLEDEHVDEPQEDEKIVEKPEWTDLAEEWGERLIVPEWEDENYRTKNEWKGQDLIHSEYSAVRVEDYYVKYGEGISGHQRGGVDTELSGVAFFSHRAESHKGLCHGGSMTSLLDDVVGWCGFLVTGECLPWSGFTVQINSSLQKPIKVNSYLKVSAKIVKVERRKVFITAQITDPTDDSVHASCEGIVIVNKGLLEYGETQ